MLRSATIRYGLLALAALTVYSLSTSYLELRRHLVEEGRERSTSYLLRDMVHMAHVMLKSDSYDIASIQELTRRDQWSIHVLEEPGSVLNVYDTGWLNSQRYYICIAMDKRAGDEFVWIACQRRADKNVYSISKSAVVQSVGIAEMWKWLSYSRPDAPFITINDVIVVEILQKAQLLR
jgi:hypothetical protein